MGAILIRRGLGVVVYRYAHTMLLKRRVLSSNGCDYHARHNPEHAGGYIANMVKELRV